MEDKNVQMAQCVARAVEAAGGRTYYVGGFVRDRLLGKPNKDVDIEVHGVSLFKLESILDSLGERMLMGESFGILGLRHYDLDIAMPRSEHATGRGHRDFAVSVDPFIGPERAARRRDFTINALMQDVLTEEVLDFFGGQDDLTQGRIQHVDATTFVEDPLRVLRAAQFAARFGFRVTDNTRGLCSTMDLGTLSRERIFEELKKALLKAATPSVFFEELRVMNQLDTWFDEVKALQDTPQPPSHHPEGDAWNHTMQVLDQAAKLRSEASSQTEFMLAALAHDLGKSATTTQVDGAIHAYGHEREGVPVTRKLLGRLTTERHLTLYVLNMVELHMRPNILVASGAKPKSYMHLFDASVCPEDLLLLAKADHLGRVRDDGVFLFDDYEPTECRLREMLAEYRRRMAMPHATGDDLIEAGFKPGPDFKLALDHAHKLRLAGRPKKDQVASAIAILRRA